MKRFQQTILQPKIIFRINILSPVLIPFGGQKFNIDILSCLKTYSTFYLNLAFLRKDY